MEGNCTSPGINIVRNNNSTFAKIDTYSTKNDTKPLINSYSNHKNSSDSSDPDPISILQLQLDFTTMPLYNFYERDKGFERQL